MPELHHASTELERLNQIPMEKLHPRELYRLQILSTIERGYDDDADMENLLAALEDVKELLRQEKAAYDIFYEENKDLLEADGSMSIDNYQILLERQREYQAKG